MSTPAEDRRILESLMRQGVDTQTESHAAEMMKSFLAPNQPKGEERQGINKLAAHYQRAHELISREFNEPHGSG